MESSVPPLSSIKQLSTPSKGPSTNASFSQSTGKSVSRIKDLKSMDRSHNERERAPTIGSVERRGGMDDSANEEKKELSTSSKLRKLRRSLDKVRRASQQVCSLSLFLATVEVASHDNVPTLLYRRKNLSCLLWNLK